MATINIWLNKGYIKKDGTATVFIHTYVKRKKVRFNTGVAVAPQNWDSEKKQVKGKGKAVKDKNLIIKNCVSRLHDIFVRYRLQNKELTPNILRKEYKTPSIYIDFYDFMDKTIQEKTGIVSKNTLATHKSLKHKLKAFSKDVLFADITPDFIEDFHKFMKLRLKNNPNTIYKTLRTLRAYMNIALRKKVISENPFDSIKLKTANVERVFLEEHEVRTLIHEYQKGFLPGNLHYVLKYFLFACFTGLRISDIKRITFDNIVNDTLVFQPYKTRGMAKVVKVPLTEPAKRYLYDKNEKKIRGTIFRPYSDQVTNRMLKRIMDYCGIQKDISFHCARHTFATLYLRKTRDLAGLQKLLGHYSITETMKYTHIIIDDIQKTIQVFNKY